MKTSGKGLSRRGEKLLKHAPNSKGFITRFNPDWCRDRYLHLKTPKEALFADVIKISEIVQAYDEETVQLWLVAWLVNLSGLMDFEINDAQANETAIFILEELYMLNVAELTLFFKRLKKGHYGVFYNKFNIQTILRAGKEYRMERGKIVSGMTSEEQRNL